MTGALLSASHACLFKKEHLDLTLAVGDLHLRNKNSTTEDHPMLFCSALHCLNHRSNENSLAFILFQSSWGSLCLLASLRLMDDSGVPSFGVCVVRTSRGWFGNMLLKHGHWHSVTGDPHKRQILVPLTPFLCLKIYREYLWGRGLDYTQAPYLTP